MCLSTPPEPIASGNLGPGVKPVMKIGYRFHALLRQAPLIALAVGVLCSLSRVASGVQREEAVIRAKSLVAEKFELVDAKGRPAASLQKGLQGQPILSFFDDNGTARFNLGMTDDGQPSLTLADEKGRARISLFLANKDGEPLLSVSSGSPLGGTRLDMSSSADGPILTLSKPKQGRIEKGVVGEPAISLRDSDDRLALLIKATDDGPKVSMLGKNGLERAKVNVRADGSLILMLADVQGTAKLRIEVDRKGEAHILKVSREEAQQ
jgi:hypothetical protein